MFSVETQILGQYFTDLFDFSMRRKKKSNLLKRPAFIFFMRLIPDLGSPVGQGVRLTEAIQGREGLPRHGSAAGPLAPGTEGGHTENNDLVHIL